MSKIALTPNASGSGTFTIASPNSNTDRTLTLPDSAGTIATTNGITMADQFRLTSDLTGSANPITSNLERVNSDGFGGIGTGMSESSGIFTFPSTGVYLIFYNIVQYTVTTGDYARGFINTTTDGSSFGSAAVAYGSGASTGIPFNSGSTQFVFDVTNTTTHKVSFRILQANTGNKIRGNANESTTSMTFIRLGDT